MIQVHVYLDDALYERLRHAAYIYHKSQTGILRDGLRRELDHLEQQRRKTRAEQKEGRR
jgi:predicted transcriptional regulator